MYFKTSSFKRVDIFLKGEVYGIGSKILLPTQTVSTLDFHTGHHFKMPKKSFNISQMLANFSLNVWLIYFSVISFLVLIMSVKMLGKGHRLHIWVGDLMAYFGILIRQSPNRNWSVVRELPYLTLTFTVASFIFNSMFETLIKTDKVVLDLSILVSNVDDLIKSKRTLCWSLLELSNEEFSSARAGSWQHKVWNKNKIFVSKTTGDFIRLGQQADKFLGLANYAYL